MYYPRNAAAAGSSLSYWPESLGEAESLCFVLSVEWKTVRRASSAGCVVSLWNAARWKEGWARVGSPCGANLADTKMSCGTRFVPGAEPGLTVGSKNVAQGRLSSSRQQPWRMRRSLLR